MLALAPAQSVLLLCPGDTIQVGFTGARSGLSAQHSVPADAGTLAHVALCLHSVLPPQTLPGQAAKPCALLWHIKHPYPRLQPQPNITDMLQANIPELSACQFVTAHC